MDHMTPLFLVGLAGTLINGVSTVLTGFAQADAARKNTELKRQQADELMARQAINEQIIREEGEKEKSIAGSQAAGSGLGGTGIGMKLAIIDNVNRTIANTSRDAEFKAKMLRAGAEQDTQLASDYVTSGIISGAGSVLSASGDHYLKWDKYGSPSSSTKGLW